MAEVGSCAVDGCERPRRKRGWCGSHYSQWRRWGEVRPISRPWSDERFCLVCGTENGGHTSRKFCSPACVRYWHNNGKTVPTNPNCARCGVEIDLAERGRKGQRRRRTVKLCRRCKAHHRTEATPGQLARRDGPYCGLCGCDVDLRAVSPDPMRPSVDHIIPRALGGSDAVENNQLTHLLCNQIKSDRLVEGVLVRG